jgi:hypothetical protein
MAPLSAPRHADCPSSTRGPRRADGGSLPSERTSPERPRSAPASVSVSAPENLSRALPSHPKARTRPGVPPGAGVPFPCGGVGLTRLRSVGPERTRYGGARDGYRTQAARRVERRGCCHEWLPDTVIRPLRGHIQMPAGENPARRDPFSATHSLPPPARAGQSTAPSPPQSTSGRTSASTSPARGASRTPGRRSGSASHQL